jgi:hypothetical protein
VQLSSCPQHTVPVAKTKMLVIFVIFCMFHKSAGKFSDKFFYSSLSLKGFFLHFLYWDEHNLGISKLYCHVGFQDLLMNLVPGNSNGMIHVSSHPTPASQNPPSDPPSLTFEQYHSPLVNAYYGPNYTTLHSNTGQRTKFVCVHEPNYGRDCQSFSIVSSCQLKQKVLH